MFEYIKGILISFEGEKAILETGGIGYKFLVPANSRFPPIGEEVLLYTSLIIREDAHLLYGFISKKEKELFELLLNISGIGPKTALAIIGHIELNSLYTAVIAKDAILLSKIPGIGKKTAERLIVELKDKINPGYFVENSKSYISDALRALINLGYAPIKAQKALNSAIEENRNQTDVGKLISLALRKIV